MGERNSNGVYPPKQGRSLAEKCPELLEEWDDTEFSPTEVSYGSEIKVWWKCKECDNRWKTRVNNRVNGKGCPYCSGNSIHSDGRNSLAQYAPEIAKEWNEPSLKPSDFQYGSGKKVSWKCKVCEHEWNAVIASRVKNGRGCPHCANQCVHSDLKILLVH